MFIILQSKDFIVQLQSKVIMLVTYNADEIMITIYYYRKKDRLILTLKQCQ